MVMAPVPGTFTVESWGKYLFVLNDQIVDRQSLPDLVCAKAYRDEHLPAGTVIAVLVKGEEIV